MLHEELKPGVNKLPNLHISVMILHMSIYNVMIGFLISRIILLR